MIFSSLSFLFLFLPILLIVYYISKDNYKNYILLIFSLFFYSWLEPKYILLMILSIIMNYYFAKKIDKRKRKRKQLLIISIIVNLSFLIFFKYNNKLPLGISFYIFQEISYLIDIYKKKVRLEKNIFYFGTYISFFPQLIAGPIVRYKDIEKELRKRKYTFNNFCDGLRRFMIGFGKKVLIANNSGIVVNSIFNSESIKEYGIILIFIGLISFSIQIYYDFSGYSDMAIGLAKMFGFNLIENFNYPYISLSIKDFWRRWHISLSNWFKDYVYIPLGGNKKYIRNIILVWLLTGLWHGAGWNYILWGMYFAFLLLIENKLESYLTKIPTLVKWFITFFLINIGWLFFKVENINTIIIIIKNIITLKKYNILEFLWNNYLIINNFIFILIGIIFIFPIKNIFQKHQEKYSYCLLRDIIISIIFVLSICSLINNNYNPFLYFRF